VHVVVGQNLGEGVQVGTRSLWDADTDHYASDALCTVSPPSGAVVAELPPPCPPPLHLQPALFAVATVYGVYLY
jgi:hypothetical protein